MKYYGNNLMWSLQLTAKNIKCVFVFNFIKKYVSEVDGGLFTEELILEVTLFCFTDILSD